MVAIRWNGLAIGVLGGVIAGGLLIGHVALADHNEPEEAEKRKSSLVRAFVPCVPGCADADPSCRAPNILTPLGPFAIGQCAPAQPVDTVCGIDPDDGEGKVLTKVLDGDIKIKVEVDKLTAGCEGETLVFTDLSRTTLDDCIDTSGVTHSSCTGMDLGIPPGFFSCVVSDGKCEIDTTVNTAFGFDVFGGGGRVLGSEQLGCGLARVTEFEGPPPFFISSTVQTFSCGILVE